MTAIRPGLCSVTFRALAPERIVDLAADAGLAAIEWGGDGHVPPGDLVRAEQMARATADAGLVVASYGSYFRAEADEDLTPILDSAEALGADRVRIWAGRLGSVEATADERASTIARLQSAASEAQRRGIGLALEFHAGTLADSAPATLSVLSEVDSTALSTYWQPTVAASDDIALAEYEAVAMHTSAVHVFSWWPQTQRLRLHERGELWRRIFAAAAAQSAPPRDALLEFVPDDDPALLAAEAATLRGSIRSASPR
ncbi:sugar phosphate isomerase/epimerase family protein [Microbacterium murale]|uniref:3-dehydroshikimate dehydratase n=1 Tax=Microbacterium murale TaxID=1081040 RepID=A0ABU0P671_9MICO|nr:TIM barrel protein [Microbacterium murale]MDQ0642829.1 3-dehydroshikimate dehydratase [Microbacterium murale]